MKAFARLLLVLALVAPSFASAQSQTAPAPTCTLFASAATVAPNTKVRLDWTSKNASAGYLTEVGPIPAAGYAFVVPGKNTTYAASFTGPGGSVVCRVAVVVSAGSGAAGGGATGTGTTGTGTGVPTSVPNQPNVVAPTGSAGGLTAPTGNGFVGGLVPLECRGRSTIANCDLCSLAQLIQNVSNFLLGLSVPAAALLFAWAGIRLFAARGVAEHINAAKKIFKTVLIGFLIIVSVWALVNTAMQMLMNGGQLKDWNWRTLDCRVYRAARLYNMSIKDYLNTSLPTLSGYTNVAPTSDPLYNTSQCGVGSTFSVAIGGCVDNTTGECTYSNCGIASGAGLPASQVCPSSSSYSSSIGGCVDNTTGECTYSNCGVSVVSGSGSSPSGVSASRCPSGYTYTTEEGGYCENPNNPDDWVEARDVSTSGSGTRISNPQMAAQIEAACAEITSVNCDNARRIALNESGGGRDCRTSPTGAAGCMQVLATTACGIDSSISSNCNACLASRNSTSAACSPVIDTISSNPQLGVNLGVQYIANMQNMPALQRYQDLYGACQITAAAYYAGPGAVLQAGGVISNIRVPPGAPSASSYVATACR